MRISNLLLISILTLGCALEPPTLDGSAGMANGGGNAAAGMSSSGSGGLPISSGGSTSMAGFAPQGGVGGTLAQAGMAGATSNGGAAGSGMVAGAAGSGPELMEVAKALDGLHLDDACGNISSDTCIHVKTNPYEEFKEVTIGGSPGTMYDVTVRFRGVFETASITGGTEPAEFANDKVTIDGLSMRKKPLTIDGTVADTRYEPWYLQVASPSHTYYLNDANKTQHTSFKVDMEWAIQMEGGTKVKIDWKDDNDHEIINKQNDSFPELGADGTSKNSGQFLHVTVTSVKLHQ